MKLKEIIFAIVTITTIYEINAHNHWKPSEDCLNGRIDAWNCCLASETTIYLKHPKYCNSYFKCAHKHLELKLCHLGQHWSVEHQKCKKPKEAQCENTSATTTTTTPKATTTTIPSQWQLPDGCFDGSINVNECCKMSQKWYELIPDQNDCHKFYKCYKGKSYHLRCPPHSKWSDEKRKCVYSLHTGCGTKTTTPTVITTESTLTTIAPGRLPNGCYDGSIPSSECCKMDISKSTKDIPIESLIRENFDLNEIRTHNHHSSSSEEKLFNGELLADPKDCHKYYKCVLGKPLHLSCPYHTKWNVQSRKCIYAFNTKCTDPESTTSTTTTTEIPTTTETATSTTPAPWRLPNGCYDGSIKAKECCNMEIGKAIKDIQSVVAENFDLEANLRHHHSSEEQFKWNNETLADLKDCHKYFQCKSGKPVHLSCPNHNKWSIELGKCVYSSSKKCTDPEPTSTTEETTVTTLPSTITTSKPWRLPDGCYDGSIKATQCCKIERNFSITSLIGENFDLENYRKHHSGSSSSEETINWNSETLADPKDCHKYFQCKSGKPVHLSCPNHNKWSIELGKCVYSSSKKCTDPESTTVVSASTTTELITEATTLPPTITTSKPWRLPNDCYDGSIKATQCCKIELNFSIISLIGENLDLENYSKHHSGSSSEETINWNSETLADPKDCHKYYQCKNGKPVHLSCPNHNKWNVELGKCVYSDNKKCTDPDPTTKPTITTTEEKITSSVTETTSVSTTTAAPWRLPEGCYDGSIKAPKCCKVRINGTMDLNSSSSSSISSSKERQDIPLETLIAENFDVIESTKHSGSKSSEEEYDYNTEALADSKNCHKYFKCKNGKPIHKSCPKHTKWNIELGQCVYAIYEKCSDPEPTTTPPLTTTEQTTTEEVTISETAPTTIDSTISNGITTTEETVTTAPYETTSTELASSTSQVNTTEVDTTTEEPTTTETKTTTEGSVTPDETTTTEATTTTEVITTTETATSISEETTSSESATTTEAPTTSEERTTTEAVITTDAISSTETTTSTTEGTTSTEAVTTTERPTTSEETATSDTDTSSTIEAISTETSTSDITTTEAATTPESFTSTTEFVTTNTDDDATSTTEAITTTQDFSNMTTEIVTSTETASTATTETVASTTEDSVTTTETTTTTTEALTTTEISATTTTEEHTTTEDIATSSEAVTTSSETITTTEEIPTTETTISTTTTPITTTELPNNSTTESNTDPTPDPNGSCGTASYKCRHGIISAEECCKGVPYWEDRLLQNNDNCGTYFQCVHEVPQVRICPAGLYWNADVCRCEWKQLSTCNF